MASSDSSVDGWSEQPEIDRSGKSVFVLIGPTGAKKSSTANHLCGIKNPAMDLEGDALKAAQTLQKFKTPAFEDETGDSWTKECLGGMGEEFYVVDTPGFGDTESGSDEQKLRENNGTTALTIVKYLQARNRWVDALVFFPSNPLMNKKDVLLQCVMRDLMVKFGNGQELLDHLIIAQPFDQQVDIDSSPKQKVAEKARKVMAGVMEQVIKENPEVAAKGLNNCQVPAELPYACFCPFDDGGGSPFQTAEAFRKALRTVRENITRKACQQGEEVQLQVRVRFPPGKCERCSYEKPIKNEFQVLTESEKMCHPEIRALTAFERLAGRLFAYFARKFPIVLPDSVWVSFNVDQLVCNNCQRQVLTKGCTETSAKLGHKFPDCEP